HEHDAPVVEHRRFLVRWLRVQIAKTANIVVVPNDERAHRLRREFSKLTGPEIICVWNCPRTDEIPDQPIRRYSANQQQNFRLYYHGTINPERLPIAVVHAISRFQGIIRLKIVGYEPMGSVGYSRELSRAAAALG